MTDRTCSDDPFKDAVDGTFPPPGPDPRVASVVDVTSLLILSATADGPRTVRDLAVELELPIASLYRRVRVLRSAGILEAHKRKDHATGKETMMYESLLAGIQIRFTAPAPTVEFDFRGVSRHFV